jgi:hypothetical protein
MRIVEKLQKLKNFGCERKCTSYRVQKINKAVSFLVDICYHKNEITRKYLFFDEKNMYHYTLDAL